MKESNLMHGINGYLFANLPGLDMCLNKKVSWHLIGLGNEVDIHGVNFHGQTLDINSNRKDTVNLIPGRAIASGVVIQVADVHSFHHPSVTRLSLF